MRTRIGVVMSPALAAWLGNPRDLFDLSATAAREESIFVDDEDLPPRPAPRPAQVAQPPAPKAPPPFPVRVAPPKDGMRDHHKWDRGLKTFIECPYCGEETSCSRNTLTQYGKSCPRCGSKHWFDGRTKEATPGQRAFAQKTFGKPRPKGGWFPDGAAKPAGRRVPARSGR